MHRPTSIEREDIHDLLCRFFLAFDERDWTAMEGTLADRLAIDYASSGREPPTEMSGAAFVSRRRDAVDELSKQHSFSNLLLTTASGRLKARCNYLILRFAKGGVTAGEDFFHSCGAYEFDFIREGKALKICAITQRALRNWGNRQLHGGSRKGAN